MAKTIKPELPGGFRDYLPEDAAARQRLIDVIRNTFECFGFEPLDTPGVERTEVLTGGDPSFTKQIFRVGIGDGSTADFDDMALRFDLTVPLARVIAANPNNILRPFRRYQIGNVWRGERQQAGRYREFVQCDADIVGSSSVLADAEAITLAYEVLRAIGLEQFLIKVNNRKLLNGLAGYAGFPEWRVPDVLRALDKLDKGGWKKVRDELAGLNIEDEALSAIKAFLDVDGSQSEILDKLKEAYDA